MARSRNHRASRTLLTFVAVAVALAGIFQYTRVQQAKAVASALAGQTTSHKPPTTVPIDAGLAIGPALPIAPMPSIIPTSPGGNLLAAVTTVGGGMPLTGPNSRNGLTPAIWNVPSPRTNLQTAPAEVHAPAATQPAVVNSAGVVAATTTVPQGNAPTPDAKSRLATGDLIGARKLFNDALLSAQSPNETENLKKQINDINQTLVFGPKRFADDPYGGVYSVRPGQQLASIAKECQVTWQLLARLNGMSDPRKLRAGQSLKIIKGPLHAVVTKSKFTVDIYAGSPGGPGSMYITTFPVGLGKDDSTPTGTWLIKDKVKHPTYYSPRGEGVIPADDPKNPLGPYWLGLAGTDGHAVGKISYGLHGTIEPDSIGKMSSMGCIRLRNEDIERVFELLIETKSTVVVKD